MKWAILFAIFGSAIGFLMATDRGSLEQGSFNNRPKEAKPPEEVEPCAPIETIPIAEPPEMDSLETESTGQGHLILVEEAPQTAPLLPESDAQSDEVVEVEERPSYPYSLYLGSYRTVEQADRVAQSMNERGFSAYRVKVNLGEMGTWYRVFAGCFQTAEEAESAKRALDIREAEVKKTAYSNFVGFYDSPQALEAAKARLVSAGYSPYAILEKDGLAWLHAGAFYTKVGAQRLNRELKEDGIASETVIR